jgi:PIN domain nuclease of toxin-antitoxin system
MGELVALNDHRGYLLDTHTFLWAARNPKRLRKAAHAALEAPGRCLCLSSFSAYEVVQKLLPIALQVPHSSRRGC